MDRALRTAILEILTPLPCMQSEESRRAALYAAGLETVLAQIDVRGDPTHTAATIVQRLDQYGTLEDGTPALVALLHYLATQVGSDKQAVIQDVCKQLITDYQEKENYDSDHLTAYVASRPTEPEPPPISTDFGPNPYKGLSAFQETDASRFFGRERVTQTLYDTFYALHERPLDVVGSESPTPLRLLTILGPSGSGKSSVVRAGLLPKLAAQPLPGTQRARVVVFTPGTRPLETLAMILARIDPSSRTLAAKALELTDILKLQTDGLHDGLRRIADTLPDIDSQSLILLIDQFEEVYPKDVNPDERRQFLDNLLCAAADPSGHVSIILTLRSDFLGQTQSHPDFNLAIAECSEIVPVMNETELRQAITKPAENTGHTLDEACIDLLIEQTRGREGALPLLQFALTRIWDGLVEGISPADTLKHIGGVGGALAGEAQRLYEKLSDADQAIARRAFLALVQLGEGTRDTRRRIQLSEIVAHGEEPAHVQAVVRCFADPRARLVTLSALPDGTETAEVTHEALLDHWETLREWLDDNREDLRFHRHLAADAEYWQAQGQPDGKLWRSPDLDLLQQYHERAHHDMTPGQIAFFEASVRKERQTKRMRRLAVTALATLTVIALGAAGVAWWAYDQANERKAEAERRYFVSKAQSLVTFALQENFLDNREQAALLAWQAFRLNRLYQGEAIVEIEEALRTIFRTSAIQEEPGSAVLLDQVCQKVKFKVTLTAAEWSHYVDNNVPYVPACPELLEANRISLRNEPMVATDYQALSLNLNASGKPKRFVENVFEEQGDVIIDHATGLMWQRTGEEWFGHNDALKYIAQLNQEKFAGYTDWRLPTVPELMSLITQEYQSNNHYLDPIFDIPEGTDWYWAWSADLRKTKDTDSWSGSSWGVYFGNGGVHWDSLNSSNCVRAVRSIK